ncbi:hypothetical protein [Streptomyces melanogenes]|uniref:Secreted protein n=1 Tax=Streptomyces melanogenes TaxID=67326 RepID=A0ABZ1XMI4_9ACTN|nr:hypothetical protein [Streptomyces melanogenes]
MGRRSKLLTGRAAATLALALSSMALGPLSAAHAEGAPESDDPIVISDTGNATAKLTIVLDKQAPEDRPHGDDTPVMSDEQVADELAKFNDVVDVASTPEPAGTLSAEELSVLSADNASQDTPEAADDTATPMRVDPGGGGGRSVLKCYDNRSWSDARGTFMARHNCAYNNINWGYKISPAVRAIISSPVRETGLRWWKNRKSQPANSPHTVGSSYLFHGTLGKVNSWDAVDYQDYMTFSVRIGGRTGRGTLTFAGGVVTIRG